MLNKFIDDTRGQFAIMFAILSTLLMLCVVVAVDLNNIIATKTKVAQITDAAALAGAESFDDADRLQVVQAFLEENGHKMLPAKFNGEPVIQFDDEAGEVKVFVRTTVELPFARVFGMKETDVGYSTLAGFPSRTDPLTIVFALDTSTSMSELTSDGRVKMDALKAATSQMFDVIEDEISNVDRIDKVIRTGLSGFSGKLSAEQDISWGFDETEKAIQRLRADGWTNTKVALENVHEQILKDRVYRKAMNPELDLNTIDEFVIFMTDGENTAGDQVVLDNDSYEACIAMREDGIEVFSIAFAAPEDGQILLLNCASWDDKTDDKVSGRNDMKKKKCRKRDDDDDDDDYDDDDDDFDDDDDDNNAGGNGRGKALGLKKCDNRLIEDKKNHYYDAEDAQSFEEIFQIIARKISEGSIRIKS